MNYERQNGQNLPSRIINNIVTFSMKYERQKVTILSAKNSSAHKPDSLLVTIANTVPTRPGKPRKMRVHHGILKNS